jgi:hypothetical protein
MKTFLCIAAACGAIAFTGAAALISQDQSLVSTVLTDLKFEPVAGKAGLVGAPPKFKVTKKTLAHLETLLKDNKSIEIQPDGKLKIGK